jgi:hypothetical protein
MGGRLLGAAPVVRRNDARASFWRIGLPACGSAAKQRTDGAKAPQASETSLERPVEPPGKYVRVRHGRAEVAQRKATRSLAHLKPEGQHDHHEKRGEGDAVDNRLHGHAARLRRDVRHSPGIRSFCGEISQESPPTVGATGSADTVIHFVLKDPAATLSRRPPTVVTDDTQSRFLKSSRSRRSSRVDPASRPPVPCRACLLKRCARGRPQSPLARIVLASGISRAGEWARVPDAKGALAGPHQNGQSVRERRGTPAHDSDALRARYGAVLRDRSGCRSVRGPRSLEDARTPVRPQSP